MLGPLPTTPVHINWLIWVKAKDRSTGVTQASGLWTGSTSRNLVISGETRTYYGGGSILDFSKLTMIAGASSIQSQTVDLNGLTPEVEAMIRGYESRQAEVEIHRWFHSPRLKTGGTIERAVKGRIDEVEFTRDALDESGGGVGLTCRVTIMTAARQGTRPLPLKKSNAVQKLAFPNDDGRLYSSTKAKVVWMGEVRDPYKVSAFSIQDEFRRRKSY